ncbi:hypothetical protein TTHERM_001220343 (macronuclear) [Tetrahymena thermophila SB210]|uniref:Uncharacterized protein n=1 Tax=Tetrahymena thermophila (strain SB210) TaxID=312017 RepID=W7X577_TETTS|nr:hypothetical protein TTHERM_001220343 [Tetrahymena thermophila SB210]EWS71518.1 hypothetical protein TTHERM_001220343 [Tetrahymena thermophila SB210]|eukprot:XP_012655946.1 hypothetical protein TTHERM_001220343 [Tetrahymena thermophila SB210]
MSEYTFISTPLYFSQNFIDKINLANKYNNQIDQKHIQLYRSLKAINLQLNKSIKLKVYPNLNKIIEHFLWKNYLSGDRSLKYLQIFLNFTQGKDIFNLQKKTTYQYKTLLFSLLKSIFNLLKLSMKSYAYNSSKKLVKMKQFLTKIKLKSFPPNPKDQKNLIRMIAVGVDVKSAYSTDIIKSQKNTKKN